MEYKTLQVEFELDENEEYQIKEIFVNNKFDPTFDWFDRYTQDTTFYVNNLNIFYIYLIKYLLNWQYKCQDKLANRTFSYVYKGGKCSNVKVKNEHGTNIIFVNFKSKFGVDFGTEKENQELIKYAIKKGRTGCSLGGDAFREFVKTQFNPKRYLEFVAHKLIREDSNYPIFEYSSALLEAKENVSGYQMSIAGTYQNIYDYDLESSYPAQLLCDMPKGLPKIYTNIEDVPSTYFKIITFVYYNCEPIPNKIQFVNVGVIGQISLTERMFELFKENYKADIKITQITAFKTQKSPFVQFIYENIIEGKKNEPRKHIAKYNKYIGNSIIGYFGRNTQTSENGAQLNAGHIETSVIDKNIDPVYLPVYLSVLDRAKSQFIRTVQRHQDCIIYANTDGFLTTKPLDTKELNFENCLPIGNYREKNKYVQIYIECINGYAGIKDTGEIDNTISGMTLESVIDPEQYRNRQFDYYIHITTPHGTIKKQKITPHQ